MKYILLLLGLVLFINGFSQKKIPVYCFPGQGADKRLFNSITIDSSKFDMIIIEYDASGELISLEKFAKDISKKIDTSGEFILIGVSLGGMICVELSEILSPSKTIIISSAKNRNEFPQRYKFQKSFPIYKAIPADFLLFGAKVLQPLVEPDRNNHKLIFKSMLNSKDPIYMKNSIGMIMSWNRTTNNKKIYHIHGAKDNTLPLKNIQDPDYIIKDGSHMMTLTRGEEISDILNKILSNK